MKKKLFIFLIALSLILISLQVFYTSRRATDGDRLNQLELQLASIKQENNRLQNQVLQYTSIAAVQDYIQKNNLVPLKLSTLNPAPVAVAHLP